MAARFAKERITESLSPERSAPNEDMLWLAGATPEVLRHLHATLPPLQVPAAVLVPLVERAPGWTVLLTQRASSLKEHAGQISFPGGRIEAQDADAWQAALRECREEIGLTASMIEFAGYLPDHWVATGYRITPVVGFVSPEFELRIAQTEVHDVFEVPLDHILDEANHTARHRELDGLAFEAYDIPYAGRTIWGATATILLTLRQRLRS